MRAVAARGLESWRDKDPRITNINDTKGIPLHNATINVPQERLKCCIHPQDVPWKSRKLNINKENILRISDIETTLMANGMLRDNRSTVSLTYNDHARNITS